MDRSHVLKLSAFAAGLVIFGACGSAPAARSGAAPPTSVPARLDLATSGRPAPAAAAVPTPSNAGPAIFTSPPLRYVLDAPLPDLGANAAVRGMRAHAVSQGDVRRIAQALSLTGSPVRTAQGWEVRSGDAELSVITENGDAQVSYSVGLAAGAGESTVANGSTVAVPPGVVVNGGPQQSAPPAKVPVPAPVPTPVPTPVAAPRPLAPVDVPDARTAETSARALLDRLGVLAGQSWSTQVDESGGIAFACAAGDPCPPLTAVSARTVTFTLTLAGAPVDGVAWAVTIGAQGRVESVNGEWATPELIGTYALQSTTAAFAALQHGTARLAGPQPLLGAPGAAIAPRPPNTPVPNTPAPGTLAPNAPVPSPTTPNPVAPVVHITGVSLGVARWDAFDAGRAVVDLVPVYRFHARADGGSTYDIEVLALDPRVATFTSPGPIRPPLPSPPIAQPGATKSVSPQSP